jgi:hypothetical protein
MYKYSICERHESGSQRLRPGANTCHLSVYAVYWSPYHCTSATVLIPMLDKKEHLSNEPSVQMLTFPVCELRTSPVIAMYRHLSNPAIIVRGKQSTGARIGRRRPCYAACTLSLSCTRSRRTDDCPRVWQKHEKVWQKTKECQTAGHARGHSILFYGLLSCLNLRMARRHALPHTTPSERP